MPAMAKKKKTSPGSICQNKKARHDYHINETFEAGLVLTGWEVKSLRAGRAQITESYVLLKNGEAWLFGAQIEPLKTACNHVIADPHRTRKLLLHRNQIAKLFVATQQEGRACVPLALYWKGPHIKCEIAIATGKKQHDKRAAEKDRDWDRDKQRVMRHNV
jgi:SsrA-binding protein